MEIVIKKSKILWVCILPVLCLLGSIDDVLNPYANQNSTFQTFASATTTSGIALIIFNIVITILLFSIYFYIGILFYRKRNILSYKILAIINFFWFGINIIGMIALSIFNTSSVGNHANILANTILSIIIGLFQAIDIFLLVNYNKYQSFR